MDRQARDDILSAAADDGSHVKGVITLLVIGGIGQAFTVVPADFQLQIAIVVHEYRVVVAPVILRIAVDRAVRQFDAVVVIDSDNVVQVADRLALEQPRIGISVIDAPGISLADLRCAGSDHVGPDRLLLINHQAKLRIVELVDVEHRGVDHRTFGQIKIHGKTVAVNGTAGPPGGINPTLPFECQVAVKADDAVDRPVAIHHDFGICTAVETHTAVEFGIFDKDDAVVHRAVRIDHSLTDGRSLVEIEY